MYALVQKVKNNYNNNTKKLKRLACSDCLFMKLISIHFLLGNLVGNCLTGFSCTDFSHFG